MRPSDNLRNKFRNHDLGISTEALKRCSKREAHSEPTDEYLWFGFGLSALSRKIGKGLFGTADATVHQLIRAKHD